MYKNFKNTCSYLRQNCFKNFVMQIYFKMRKKKTFLQLSITRPTINFFVIFAKFAHDVYPTPNLTIVPKEACSKPKLRLFRCMTMSLKYQYRSSYMCVGTTLVYIIHRHMLLVSSHRDLPQLA